MTSLVHSKQNSSIKRQDFIMLLYYNYKVAIQLCLYDHNINGK
jgi:hypothetical protein